LTVTGVRFEVCTRCVSITVRAQTEDATYSFK